MYKDEITFIRFDDVNNPINGSILIRADRVIGIAPWGDIYHIHTTDRELICRIKPHALKTMHLVKLTANGVNEDRDVIRVQDNSPEEVLAGLKAAILDGSVTTT